MVSKEIQQSFRRIGGVALASVLLASCSQEWTSADKFNFSDRDTNPYAKGKAEMASGRYGMAIEAFRKAYELAPDNSTVRRNLCNAYQAQANELARSADFQTASNVYSNR